MARRGREEVGKEVEEKEEGLKGKELKKKKGWEVMKEEKERFRRGKGIEEGKRFMEEKERSRRGEWKGEMRRF